MPPILIKINTLKYLKVPQFCRRLNHQGEQQKTKLIEFLICLKTFF